MKGMNPIRNLSVAFSGAKEHHPGTRNHEVAHERPHREADRTGRAGLPRLARTHRPPRVRRMVPGQARGPLRPRQGITGHITYPGYENIRWHSVVQEMVPERLFSFTWHPYAIEPGVDYSDEPPTLVEFRLEPRGDGTLLTVTESRSEERRVGKELVSTFRSRWSPSP